MTENPYDDLLNILMEPQPLLEFPEGRGIKRKEEPLIKTLYLTLSEVRTDLYIFINYFFFFCSSSLLHKLIYVYFFLLYIFHSQNYLKKCVLFTETVSSSPFYHQYY